MKCAFCDFAFEPILNLRDDGEKRLVLCPNHDLMLALKMVEATADQYQPSEVQSEGKCDLCTKDKMYYKNGETVFDLCDEHINLLVLRHISPDEYFVLANKYGADTYAIHDDFFDPETGESLQPVRE